MTEPRVDRTAAGPRATEPAAERRRLRDGLLAVEPGQHGGTCRDCGARIYWASGGMKRVPVDCAPAPRREPEKYLGGWGTPHHLTCSYALAGTRPAGISGLGARPRPAYSDRETTRPVRALPSAEQRAALREQQKATRAAARRADGARKARQAMARQANPRGPAR